jgi:hypothetical protein
VLLPLTVTLCCAVAGRTVTIPATLSALSAPAPAVMAATFFFARRRVAWAAETWFLFIVMRPACRPWLRAACRPIMRLLCTFRPASPSEDE